MTEYCVSKFFLEISPSVTRRSPSPIAAAPSKSLDSSQNTSQGSIEDADTLTLSQLTIEEQVPLNIKPFFNMTPRNVPSSPHYIIEEDFATNPWAMLVATIFLTKTSGKIARPLMKSFFEEYPTPYHVLEDNPASLERYFVTLGLRKRGYMIWKLSYQFVSSKWCRASDLHGIGKYGEDAYRIFCLSHTDLDSDDRYLKLYLDWLRSHTNFSKENGMVDSETFIQDPVLKYYSVNLRNIEN